MKTEFTPLYSLFRDHQCHRRCHPYVSSMKRQNLEVKVYLILYYKVSQVNITFNPYLPSYPDPPLGTLSTVVVSTEMAGLMLLAISTDAVLL
jgi:hypothetical protein